MLIALLLLVVLILLTLAEAASDVAAGQLPPGLFWWQLIFSMPEALTIVMPLAAISGLIFSIGQAAMDQELVVLRASGLAPRKFVAAVSGMGLMMAIFMLMITGYVQPWSYRLQQDLKEEAARSAQLWGMQPGRFVRIPGMDGVAYIAAIDDEGFALRQIFIVVHNQGEDEILTATRGIYRLAADGRRYIELEQGQRIEIPEHNLAVRSARFLSGVLEMPQHTERSPDNSVAGQDLLNLMLSPTTLNWRELNWRLAAPLALWLLTLYGMAIALWGTGQGRAWRSLAGIGVYILYLQALNLAQLRIGQGVWGGAAIWWVHGFLLVVLLPLLFRSMRRF